MRGVGSKTTIVLPNKCHTRGDGASLGGEWFWLDPKNTKGGGVVSAGSQEYQGGGGSILPGRGVFSVQVGGGGQFLRENDIFCTEKRKIFLGANAPRKKVFKTFRV